MKNRRLGYADKMHLKFEMEYWFLYFYYELVYPNSEATFTPYYNLKERYYNTHNVHPVVDVIVRNEGDTKEFSECLKKLTFICHKNNLIII